MLKSNNNLIFEAYRLTVCLYETLKLFYKLEHRKIRKDEFFYLANRVSNTSDALIKIKNEILIQHCDAKIPNPSRTPNDAIPGVALSSDPPQYPTDKRDCSES